MLPRFHPRHRLKTWPPRRPFDPYLVAYYSGVLGSGSVLYDESPHLNHGTIYGAAWADGKIRPALSFDGVDDYVDCGRPTILNLVSEYSILLWVKPVDPSVEYRIFAKQGSALDSHLVARSIGNRLTYDGADAAGWKIGLSSGVVASGVWWHVCATVDVPNSIARLYVNGAVVSTDRDIGEVSLDNYNWFLGKSERASIYYKGIVDDVRIYSRALSRADVLRCYLRLA